VDKLSLDKQKLLEWLKGEVLITVFNDSNLSVIRQTVYTNLIDKIQTGSFDSSDISSETQSKIKLRVEEILKEKAQEQLNLAVEVLKWIRDAGTDYQSINKAKNFLSSLSKEV